MPGIAILTLTVKCEMLKHKHIAPAQSGTESKF